ncbi:MAG TPA: tetratricopeptide repeat protein [Verrucomicrobiota bacterium]|jgi:tetratricopeptide (TPR) repeat protein|nr:tetratricopeptide repeat protein [Verrucomicrobiota bacterium]OQC26634.1 MAG: Tetratricopeptide repeat protein [Verrucomicrobia bacterium ADurb.Bin063]HRR63669.1 tetratricopeptide repeat protein [Candidatus Paceibacterota bacterium]MBP8015212.1 tetratricopeptide repeat protein [Verrucomicrobiota bacterium]MDI9373786.1 tetratricopeptide repeat protein [Verrucomicrobiota bacterium]
MAEKSLSELPRELRLLFTKGNDALQRENLDYAIALFNQVLAKEPALFECRQALRSAQSRKASGGRGFFKKIMSSAGSSPQLARAHLALGKDPAEALRIAEQILNGDPANSAAHKLVVEAANALDLPKTAVMSLEILVAHSPNDQDIAVKYAHALANAGEVGKAEAVLANLYRAAPHDQELAQALKNLSARKTLDEGGYEALADGTGSYRDILKDKEEAVLLEQQNRQVKTEDVAERLIQEYEGRLAAEPGNLKLLRQLAELYTQKQQFDRALSYYDRIKASEVGADASLDRNIADTVMRRYEHQMAQLDATAPDYADKLAALQAEKQAYQLAECQKRAERFPTDLQIRFELGQLYFQAGRITEAMREFQKAQSNPHRRIQALSYLGQCFARRGIHDLAATTFQDALKEKVVFDEEKKELIYLLGSVYETMGKRDDAIAQFKIIYAADVGYKDVADKIDAYYDGAAGG